MRVEMPTARRIRAAIIVAGAAAVALACLLLTHGSRARGLSLAFDRYGGVVNPDHNRQGVAFLWFTNSSATSYSLIGSMDYGSRSYIARAEFGDPAKPLPQVSLANAGSGIVVSPHSTLHIRVPLPPRGENQKVAVLCVEMGSASPRMFWTNGAGLWIVRAMPRSVGKKLLFHQPEVFWVWSDFDLSRPAEIADDGVVSEGTNAATALRLQIDKEFLRINNADR